MLVVFHHALHERDGSFSPFHDVNLGDPGVMIFLVISGFVMLQSCRDEPALTFARRRIIRIVPLCWMFTLVFFLLIARADFAVGDPFRRLPERLSFLFFIPHHHSGVPEQIWPIPVPGWTLNCEAFFFAFVLAALMTKAGTLGLQARLPDMQVGGLGADHFRKRAGCGGLRGDRQQNATAGDQGPSRIVRAAQDKCDHNRRLDRLTHSGTTKPAARFASPPHGGSRLPPRQRSRECNVFNQNRESVDVRI